MYPVFFLSVSATCYLLFVYCLLPVYLSTCLLIRSLPASYWCFAFVQPVFGVFVLVNLIACCLLFCLHVASIVYDIYYILGTLSLAFYSIPFSQSSHSSRDYHDHHHCINANAMLMPGRKPRQACANTMTLVVERLVGVYVVHTWQLTSQLS